MADHSHPTGSVSRRDFARLFAVGGSAALFSHPAWAQHAPAIALPAAGVAAGEPFWAAVRAQFVMPPGLAVMNAANLCPASAPVIEALTRETKHVDTDPSQQNRARLAGAREDTRKHLAAFLRVTPEEIVITRNTSESNNLVSNGIDLKPGDEVLIFADNHPSNHSAWTEKAKRFGFTVNVVEQKNPHPGSEYYVDAFSRALTPRTKLLSFTHLTSSVGDLFPATALCRLARERGVLSMVDGAQSFGLLDVNLAEIQPDFYTGSAHKWPCGARECGVLYINARTHHRIWPSSYSAYPGAIGVSRKMEAFGQRDEATMIAFSEALAFQTKIGRGAIEARSRALAQQLMAGLKKINGFTVWTNPAPELSAAVVSFQPGTLDTRKLLAALYEKDKVGVTSRGGTDRPGLRVSPHFYNTPQEIDRLLAALSNYQRTGV
ncbi:MAG TPA: aminotransferase class V-fold PLP-dependent enzyme [Vicinamibacterales bacterium]|nr:aminotransferase class V-fold PLP-dependent enzyme [Vicinamibacterales bacterium]